MEATWKTAISEGPDGKLVITMEIPAQGTASFLEQEEDLARLLNEAGRLATQSLLKQYDREERSVVVEGERHYRKGAQKKSTRPPTGG
jgi:hypothetical protein